MHIIVREDEGKGNVTDVIMAVMTEDVFRKYHPECTKEEYYSEYCPDQLLIHAAEVYKAVADRELERYVTPETAFSVLPLGKEYADWLGTRKDTAMNQQQYAIRYFCKMSKQAPAEIALRAKQTVEEGLSHTDVLYLLPVVADEKKGFSSLKTAQMPSDAARSIEKYIAGFFAGNDSFDVCVLPYFLSPETVLLESDMLQTLAGAKFSHGQRAMLGRYAETIPDAPVAFIPVFTREEHNGRVFGSDLFRNTDGTPMSELAAMRDRLNERPWTPEGMESRPDLYEGFVPFHNSDAGKDAAKSLKRAGMLPGKAILIPQLIGYGEIPDFYKVCGYKVKMPKQ